MHVFLSLSLSCLVTSGVVFIAFLLLAWLAITPIYQQAHPTPLYLIIIFVQTKQHSMDHVVNTGQHYFPRPNFLVPKLDEADQGVQVSLKSALVGKLTMTTSHTGKHASPCTAVTFLTTLTLMAVCVCCRVHPTQVYSASSAPLGCGTWL